MRAFAIALTLFATSCSAEERARLDDVVACADFAASGGALEPGECRLEANGESLHVRFVELAEGATGGAVSVDVLGAGGGVRQVLLEENVSEYIAPSVQDVDGDGRGDALIPRESGNVNIAYGVWIFTDAGLYRRAGEVSGVQILRTDEGLIAVPARSGAAAWNVAFHRLDESGLALIASVSVEAEPEANGALTTRCQLADAPGLALLNLTAEAAQSKFCAEPAAAGVFGP